MQQPAMSLAVPRGVRLTEDGKFIIVFTVCFVVAAVVILGAGYLILNVTGILGPGNDGASASTPTITPGPIGTPTIEAPTATPMPTKPIIIPPTVTPSPTPTPTPPSVYSISIAQDVSTRNYWVSFEINPSMGNKKLDMSKVVISVWDAKKVYKNYTYDEAVFFGAEWKNSNGDAVLEPGETFVYKINGYTLGLATDVEQKMTIVIDGRIDKSIPMPMMQNPATTPEYGDPGSDSVTTPAYPPDNWQFPTQS